MSEPVFDYELLTIGIMIERRDISAINCLFKAL